MEEQRSVNSRLYRDAVWNFVFYAIAVTIALAVAGYVSDNGESAYEAVSSGTVASVRCMIALSFGWQAVLLVRKITGRKSK